MLLNRAEVGLVRLCKNGCNATRSVRTNYLAGERRAESKLFCNLVDAAWIAELCLREAKLTILLAKLLDGLLLRLDLVADLDRREVLPHVDHREREEQRHHHGERAHLAVTLGVVGFDEPRIVEVLCE